MFTLSGTTPVKVYVRKLAQVDPSEISAYIKLYPSESSMYTSARYHVHVQGTRASSEMQGNM